MTTITKTNSKGEIKIPTKFRNLLGFDNEISIKMIIRDNGLFIYPIIPKIKKEDSYIKILEKTKGSWSDDINRSNNSKQKIELTASNNRKLAW